MDILAKSLNQVFPEIVRQAFDGKPIQKPWMDGCNQEETSLSINLPVPSI